MREIIAHCYRLFQYHIFIKNKYNTIDKISILNIYNYNHIIVLLKYIITILLFKIRSISIYRNATYVIVLWCLYNTYTLQAQG